MYRVYPFDYSRVIAYGLALAAVAGLILLGDHALLFVNIPALLIVTVPAVGLMYYRFGYNAIFLPIQPSVPRSRYIRIWRKTLWKNLWIASVVSIVQILANIDDPANLGPPLAVMLLSFLYIMIIQFFILDPLEDYNDSQSLADLKDIYSREVKSGQTNKALIVKTALSIIAAQAILIIGALSVEEYIISPARNERWDNERVAKEKKWDSVAETVTAKFDIELNGTEAEGLHFYVNHKEYSHFEIVNRVYTSKDLKREELFGYLRQLEAEK